MDKYWREPSPRVPSNPKEREKYLTELVLSLINKTPHPAITKMSESVHNERIGQLNHKASFHPPLPPKMETERAEQRRQGWRDYWATHQRDEPDHYRGDSPRRRHGGIWTGD
jgi:hypothetical protein